MVACEIPVARPMAACVQPSLARTAIFSEVSIARIMQANIRPVNTLLHSFMANNSRMDFREWLQEQLDARGIGPTDLARASKVPQPTIFRILSGETADPRIGTVRKIEAVLGKSPAAPAPIEYNELIEAWEYLLPGEQNDMLDRILRMAAHNKEVEQRATQKNDVVRRSVSLSRRRLEKATTPQPTSGRKKDAA